MAVAALAWASFAVAAVGTVASISQQRAAGRDAKSAAAEASAARGEEAAQGAKSAAQERRQQIREERVKRAQIMNQSAQTGTEDSSGEMGSIGGMSTQLGTNLGFNQGSVMRGQRITGFLQNQADFQSQAASHQARGQLFGQVGQMASHGFSQLGGWNTLFPKKV